MRSANTLMVGPLAALINASAAIGAVYSADVIIEDPVPSTSETATQPPGEARHGKAPAVYGWSSVRPADCGTFSYWDGRHCVDIRTEDRRPRG